MIRILRALTRDRVGFSHDREELLHTAESPDALLLDLERRTPLGALSAGEHVGLLLILKNRRFRSRETDVVLGANGAVYRIRPSRADSIVGPKDHMPPNWGAP